MKKLLLSFVVLVCATMSYAQQQLVATLTHGEEISMFYGAYAYRDAMNAAVDGDVINLSGGGFQACNITKAVSLRGTGVEVDNPTFLINDFEINIPEETTARLTVEGIRVTNTITFNGTLQNAYFLKCQLKSLYCSRDANVENAMFLNCKVFDLDVNSGTISAQILNSYVSHYYNSGNASASACFINCVISDNDLYLIKYSTLNNCILVNIYTNSDWRSLPSTSSATNCLAVSNGDKGNAFKDVVAGINNKHVIDFAVFTDSDYMKDLTGEAKATYLGTDGTPVGMYGGPLPFDLTPTYPQITKMNVASKTTADGKLSVDIEVSAAK